MRTSTTASKAAMVLVAVIGGMALLSACGGGSSETATPKYSAASGYCREAQRNGANPVDLGCDPSKFPSLDTATETATPADPVTTESADPGPAPLGALTVTGASGDTVKTEVSAGPVSDFASSGVPDDVVSTCTGWGTTPDNSVIIGGQLTITYTGNVSQIVGLTQAPKLMQLSRYYDKFPNGQIGDIAIQDPDGNGWTACYGAPQAWTTTMASGDSKTVDFWAHAVLKTNDHPTVTAADKQALALSVIAQAADQFTNFEAGANKISGSGAHAAKCTSDGDTANPLWVITPASTGRKTYSGGLVCRPAR